jgi:divalent metal cation (Fe/Co/Zn/Cd) transporter
MNPHSMKTRKVGGKVAVDIHIEVPRDINVVKAHDISTMVEKRIEGIFGKGTFVSVHVEPAKPERHIA